MPEKILTPFDATRPLIGPQSVVTVGDDDEAEEENDATKGPSVAHSSIRLVLF